MQKYSDLRAVMKATYSARRIEEIWLEEKLSDTSGIAATLQLTWSHP